MFTPWTVADAGPAAAVDAPQDTEHDAPVGRPPDDETSRPLCQDDSGMNRRVLLLIIGSLLLPLGCGGNDDPTGPAYATLVVATTSLPRPQQHPASARQHGLGAGDTVDLRFTSVSCTDVAALQAKRRDCGLRLLVNRAPPP